MPCRQIFDSHWSFFSRHLLELPCEFYLFLDLLSVRSRILGAGRRRVLGVRGGEIQGKFWPCSMHRLSCEFYLFLDQLPVRSRLLGAGRRRVLGVRGGVVQSHSRFCRLHLLRGRVPQQRHRGSVCGGVRGMPFGLIFS